MVSSQFHYTKRNRFMPFLLAEILNFQGSTHRIGVGSFSTNKNYVVPFRSIRLNFCQLYKGKRQNTSLDINLSIKRTLEFNKNCANFLFPSVKERLSLHNFYYVVKYYLSARSHFSFRCQQRHIGFFIYQSQPFHQFSVFCSRRNNIDPGGIHTGMSQKIRQLCDIFFML